MKDQAGVMIDSSQPNRRRPRLAFIGLAIVALFGSYAGTKAFSWFGHRSPPRLVLSEEVIDFGELPPLATVSRAVALRNTGGEVLEILRVRTSCSCTAAELPVRRLAPGGEAVLKVTFNAGDSPYSQATVSIATNDPAHKMSQIVVKARKPWGVDIVPRKIYLNGPSSQEVLVSASRGDLLNGGNEIIATSASNLINTLVVPDSEKMRVSIVVWPSEDRLTGTYSSVIHVADKNGLVDGAVGVQFDEQSQFFVSAPEVSIFRPSAVKADRFRRTVEIAHRTDSPVDVISVEIDGEVGRLLSVEDMGVEEGKTVVTISVRLDNSEDRDSLQRGHVLVSARSGGSSEMFSFLISTWVERSGE